MKKIIPILFFVIFLALSFSSFAGGMGPGGPGGGMGPGAGCWPPGNPACIPIDGGITLLIAAGLAYGGKKTLDLKKD